MRCARFLTRYPCLLLRYSGMRALILAGPLLAGVLPLFAASVYPSRLDDPKAVYLTADRFPFTPTGRRTIAALQPQSTRCRRPPARASCSCPRAVTASPERFSSGRGFASSATARIGRSSSWRARRRAFSRVSATCCSSRAGVLRRAGGGGPVRDAAGRGGFRPMPSPAGSVPPAQDRGCQPGHVLFGHEQYRFRGRCGTRRRGIRFHVAQHGFLSHMDFHVGSGLAALHDVATKARTCIFTAGATAS